MDKATVFSCRREVCFATPLEQGAAEALLRRFVACIGEKLACGGIILGHIKILAKIPGGEDFLFLSMTRADKVDAKRSAKGGFGETGLRGNVELTINVLVVGRSKKAIEAAVGDALFRLGEELSRTRTH